MRSMARWAVLVLAVVSAGCLVPHFIITETEVIRPADSTAVFGPRGELRIPGLDLTVQMKWDGTERTYLREPARSDSGHPRSDSDYLGIRVARLRGNAFLVQVAQADEGDLGPRFLLVVMRVSAAGDATPLGCEISVATAARFGVVIRPDVDPGDSLSEFVNKADGQRADIIEMLRSQLPACLPLTRFDNFAPPAGELVATRLPRDAANSAIAVRARKAGCRPCPSGACVVGTVTDESGGILPGAYVSFRAAGGRSLADAVTNGEGRFFISRAPAGNHRLEVALQGFMTVRPAKAFTIQTGRTYAFEEPFTLRVGTLSVGEDVDLMPFECPAN